MGLQGPSAEPDPTRYPDGPLKRWQLLCLISRLASLAVFAGCGLQVLPWCHPALEPTDYGLQPPLLS